MSAAYVQYLGVAGNSTAGETSTVLSPTSKTVTAGNTIVVVWGTYSDLAATGVTDNLGNTYSRIERTTVSSWTNTDLWSAPVTSGGSLTTITVAHAATQYKSIMAAEFSGVGAVAAAGGSTGGWDVGDAYWETGGTLPADGLAVGATTTNVAGEHTAGPASGSPSTTIVRVATSDTWWSVSLVYAIVGTSSVTGFDGVTASASAGGNWAAAGGIFSPSVVNPTWTTPADTVAMSTTPELKFTSPTSAVAQHFYLQLDTANTFDTGNLRTYDSSVSQTNWSFWDGDSWEALPSTGLSTAYDGNEIRYTVTSALSAATWYRRVRAGTLA